MVSIFMIHPNLQLTECDTSSANMIHRYQDQLLDSINETNHTEIDAEVQYLSSYSRILDIMEKYFSKLVLTPQDECEGLDLIAGEMKVFKGAELKLQRLKLEVVPRQSSSLNTITEEE